MLIVEECDCSVLEATFCLLVRSFLTCHVSYLRAIEPWYTLFGARMTSDDEL